VSGLLRKQALWRTPATAFAPSTPAEIARGFRGLGVPKEQTYDLHASYYDLHLQCTLVDFIPYMKTVQCTA